MTTLKLEIVDFTDDSRWRWRLLDAGGAFLADHEVALDSSSSEYYGFVDLHGYVRWNLRPGSSENEEPILLERIAKWTRSEVWGPVGDAILSAAEMEPTVVQVDIPSHAEVLLFRPFELGLLLDPSLGALDVSLVFDFGQEDKRRQTKRNIGDKLRLLALFSMPSDQTALNVRRERHELARLVRRVTAASQRAIELRILQYGVTREGLEEVLEEGDGWDLIHFSGHGLPAGLVFEHEDGSADLVPSDEFANLLRPARAQLKLVTLSSCESGATTAAHAMQLLGVNPENLQGATPPADEETATAPLPAVAQRIASELGCAALAMRYPVADDFAITLSNNLYEGLLSHGQPLTRALQRALAKAAGQTGERAEAGLSLATPALFGSAALDLTIKPPQSEPGSFEIADGGLVGSEPENFVGRVGPLTRASGALAPKSEYTAIVFHGMAGAGKTTCALELAHHHRERRFEAMAWYAAPGEGEAIDDALGQFAATLQTQFEGLDLAQVVDDADRLKAFLPGFRQLLADRSLLIVLDNLESLLTGDGAWRDPRWELLSDALVNHGGLSRVVFASRVAPASLRDHPQVRVEPIHSLSAAESVLLARQLPNLGDLMLTGGAVGLSEGRSLVRRALEMVQGNPKLLNIADKQAADAVALGARIAEANETWTDRADLEAFFATGEPDQEIGGEDFLRVIERWTIGIADTLSAHARLAFQVLCCLEAQDRSDGALGIIWPALWAERSPDSQPPDPNETLADLAGQGLIDLKKRGDLHKVGIHPAVEHAERASIDEDLQEKVDIAMSTAWMMFYNDARSRTDTRLLVHAGLAAAPYLVRRGRLEEAAQLLGTAITRDPSRPTVAAALPILKSALGAGEGTAAEPAIRGVLVKAQGVQRSEDVVPELRRLIAQAERNGDYVHATVLTGDLFNALMRDGRLDEAEETAKAKSDFTRRADLGPWTELGDACQRLGLMQVRGQNEQVLEEFKSLRGQLEELSEQSEKQELANSWNVHEVLLGVSATAAMELKDWDYALELIADVRKGHRERGAPPVVQAMVEFNRFGPLRHLKRFSEAESMLKEVRRTLEDAGEFRRLGQVFDAWAILEHERGHFDAALEAGRKALHLYYMYTEPISISGSHNNFAGHLDFGEGNPQEIVAHLLAAALIRRQTGSGDYRGPLVALVQSLKRFGPEVLPDSFEELCGFIGQVENIDFAALFALLPNSTSNGDAVLAAVIEEARELLRVYEKSLADPERPVGSQ